MRFKHIVLISIGNTVEWFDFGLFIFLAPLIGKKFFPNQDMFNTLPIVLGVFAAGFIARPVGGVFFGYIGDRLGRSFALRYSILTVTSVTLMIGLLPTYHTAGIWATVFFIALRIIQGLSIGGEYSGVMIYLAESASHFRRGFVTSFAASGANMGFLLATGVVLLIKQLPTTALESWGWRLPFLIIGGLGAVVFYFRLKLLETPAYLSIRQHLSIQKPSLALLKQKPAIVFKILGLTSMSSVFYYVFFGYIPHYLTENRHIYDNFTFSIQFVSLAMMLFLVPMAGMGGDLLGRKKMLLITVICMIFFAIPCFYLLNLGNCYAIILAMSLATLMSSLDQGNSLITVVENCPVNIRYSIVAFSYNLGMAVFGGTAPLVMNLLITHMNILAPAYYLIIMAMMGLLAVLTLPHHVHGSKVREYGRKFVSGEVERAANL